MAKVGDHAVVLGASIAGLLTRLLRPSMMWRAAWAKHRRRRCAHQTDDPTGLVKVSVI